MARKRSWHRGIRLNDLWYSCSGTLSIRKSPFDFTYDACFNVKWTQRNEKVIQFYHFETKHRKWQKETYTQQASDRIEWQTRRRRRRRNGSNQKREKKTHIHRCEQKQSNKKKYSNNKMIYDCNANVNRSIQSKFMNNNSLCTQMDYVWAFGISNWNKESIRTTT